MKKIILAISAIALFSVACNKKSPQGDLETSKVSFNPHTIMTMTGGNGNGTNPAEYTRYYELHEGNGTVDCIQTGKDCKVKASTLISQNQVDNFNLLSIAIAEGAVPSYFNGNAWISLFPELANEPTILSQLRSGSLYISKAPSVPNSYCFVLSTAPSYSTSNVLKVWYWTFSESALQAVIGSGGPVYDRVDEWSDDGRKCDCINKGQTCSAGIVSGTQQATQFNLLDNYIQVGQLKNYFLNEKWNILFPNLNDEWLNGILNGNLKLARVEDENSINYALTNKSTVHINNSNSIYVWLFQK